MNFVGIIISVCIIGIGMWFSQKTHNQAQVKGEISVEITSPTPEQSITPSPTVSLSPTLQPTKKPTVTPETKPSYTPIPNISNNTSTISIALSDFQYPGSSVSSSTSTKLELISNEKAFSITDWYKNKISALGMNAKSFVTTTTNGVVVNKLVAAGKGTEVRVDITASSSSSPVKIIVEIN